MFDQSAAANLKVIPRDRSSREFFCFAVTTLTYFLSSMTENNISFKDPLISHSPGGGEKGAH